MRPSKKRQKIGKKPQQQVQRQPYDYSEDLIDIQLPNVEDKDGMYSLSISLPTSWYLLTNESVENHLDSPHFGKLHDIFEAPRPKNGNDIKKYHKSHKFQVSDLSDEMILQLSDIYPLYKAREREHFLEGLEAKVRKHCVKTYYKPRIFFETAIRLFNEVQGKGVVGYLQRECVKYLPIRSKVDKKFVGLRSDILHDILRNYFNGIHIVLLVDSVEVRSESVENTGQNIREYFLKDILLPYNFVSQKFLNVETHQFPKVKGYPKVRGEVKGSDVGKVKGINGLAVEEVVTLYFHGGDVAVVGGESGVDDGAGQGDGRESDHGSGASGIGGVGEGFGGHSGQAGGIGGGPGVSGQGRAIQGSFRGVQVVERKGLDTVHRDWSLLSKETGDFCLDQILSEKSCEDVVESIHHQLKVLEGVIKYRWNALPVEQRDGMKNYILEVIVKLSSDEVSFRCERLSVNKLNIILVQILKHEWPASWQSFIPDLVVAAKTSETICENCMAILKLLSEEVFDFSRGEMTQQKIKELKQSLNSEFQLIHELCLYVLSASQRAELIKATLATLHAFLSWIPLGYIFESPLMEKLLGFFPVPSYRNLTLQCLTEIAALSFGDSYNPHYVKMYNVFILQLQNVLPPNTNIPEAYANGSNEERAFIQNLALFFTSFYKFHIRVLETHQENIATLLLGLEYLINISYVDGTEVFKVCLDYWNSLVLELFEAHNNLEIPAATANMMGLQIALPMLASEWPKPGSLSQLKLEGGIFPIGFAKEAAERNSKAGSNIISSESRDILAGLNIPGFDLDILPYRAQIHPEVSCLCASIEGTSSARLAGCLGLDPSKVQSKSVEAVNNDSSGSLLFIADNEERYQGCEPSVLSCPS